MSTEKYLTFNPGLIVGGSEINDNREAIGKDNIISPRVSVTGDLRFLTETQKENARIKMKEIVSKNLNKTKAEITFQDGIPSMEPTPENEKILATLNQVSLDLGFGEVKAGDPGSRGAGDISYIAKYVACLDGLGASGKGAHAPGETMNIKEFSEINSANSHFNLSADEVNSVVESKNHLFIQISQSNFTIQNFD